MPYVKFFTLSLMLLLSACLPFSSWTGLKENTQAKSFKQISVNFYSENPTSLEKIENDLLYRCAQVTLSEGYDSFVIVRGDVPLFNFYTTPHSANQYLNLHFSGYGKYPLFDDTYPANKNIHRGGSFKSAVTINMFRDQKPTGLLNAYNARELVTNSGLTGPSCY